MKTIREFNKEFVAEILKLQEKRRDFFSKKIEQYCLEKNLKIKKTEDNFEVVNVDYVEELLRNNKLKLIDEYSIFFKKVKIYNFGELNILIEENDNNKKESDNKKYKVLLEGALIDLSDWDSNYETLEDFLRIYQ